MPRFAALLPALALAVLAPLTSAHAKRISTAEAAQIFATTCGWCHENGGRQAGKGPKLAGTKRTDSFIINRIKNGKEGAMPSFDGTLNDAQIKGILHYIRTLKSE